MSEERPSYPLVSVSSPTQAFPLGKLQAQDFTEINAFQALMHRIAWHDFSNARHARLTTFDVAC